jgi:hypothetical protein
MTNQFDGEQEDEEPTYFDSGYEDEPAPIENRTVHGAFAQLPDVDWRDLSDEETDKIFDFLIETQVKPQLRAALGELGDEVGEADQLDADAELEEGMLQGEMFIFGHCEGVEQQELIKIQELLGEGMQLEYALEEFTGLHLRRQRQRHYRGMRINYIELVTDQNPVAPLSASELSDMFDRS